MRASEAWWLTHHGWEALNFCIYTWYRMSESSWLPRSYIYVSWCIQVWDMPRSDSSWLRSPHPLYLHLILYEWHTSFICVTYMSEARHTYECHIYERGTRSQIWAKHATYISEVPRWYMWHSYVTSFICVTCLAHICGIHACDVPRSCMWNSAFICVMCLAHICGIHMRDVPRSYSEAPRLYMWRASCFAQMCDMPHSSVWHGFVTSRGSLKTQVSFAKKPYKRDYILRKRLIFSRSLLIGSLTSRVISMPSSLNARSILYVSHTPFICLAYTCGVLRALLKCVACLIHMCDSPLSTKCVTCLVHMCDSPLYVWLASVCVTCLCMGDSPLYVWHASFVCVTRLSMYLGLDALLFECTLDTLRVTCLIHMRGMTHLYATRLSRASKPSSPMHVWYRVV